MMDFCHVGRKKTMRANEILSVWPNYCNLFLCKLSQKGEFSLRRNKMEEFKFTEHLLYAITSHRCYLIYLPTSSIDELHNTIFPWTKLRYKEIIWFAPNHTTRTWSWENSTQTSKSMLLVASWSMKNHQSKRHSEKDNPYFLKLFQKEIRFKKYLRILRKTPRLLKITISHALIYTFIYSERFNESG